MNRLQHLLCILMEECNEVSQRTSKTLRFGLSEVQDGQPLNNADRMNIEFNDLLAVVEMINAELAPLSQTDTRVSNQQGEQIAALRNQGFFTETVDRVLPQDKHLCWRLCDKKGNQVGDFYATENEAWTQPQPASEIIVTASNGATLEIWS